MATTFLVQRSIQPCRHNARNYTKKNAFYRTKSTASQSAKDNNLSWPEYLTIRGQKHKWETVSSFHHVTSRFL